ncbi:MAG: glutathione S-transferase family protein [Caulobacteraceae bacterium]|nr:MAG: glutathione S-transferase family protein [Caulobacteraceae bacterium]
MITVWGEGRGFRVIWLLEEMGLPYRLRDVDLLKGAESDPEFMAINPGGFIPALQDGDRVMVESVAILQYLLGRYGPSPLAVGPADPAYGDWLQFLHLGEAGLMTPSFFSWAGGAFGPDGAGEDWTGKLALEIFRSRRRLIARQLGQAPYMAGETFTAADISVGYALLWARRQGVTALTPAEQAYIDHVTAREGFDRAIARCQHTKSWDPPSGG